MRARTIVVAAVAVLAACGSSREELADGPSTFKVMTQNLYLGADLDPALAATPAELPVAVEAVWASVQATDFPSRAKIIATTIQSTSPDIVGLQEISLWRVQDPGDHLPFPNATTVVYDFLGSLQAELAARGLVAMKLVNTHLEAVSTDVAGRQAADIVGVAQPTGQPTILSADMNLTPGSPGYGNFVAPATGLVDSGTEIAGGTALTCCWDPLLTSGAFSSRIDLVFHNGGVHATSYQIVDQTETTASGLHASDHAGVVVGFNAM